MWKQGSSPSSSPGRRRRQVPSPSVARSSSGSDRPALPNQRPPLDAKGDHQRRPKGSARGTAPHRSLSSLSRYFIFRAAFLDRSLTFFSFFSPRLSPLPAPSLVRVMPPPLATHFLFLPCAPQVAPFADTETAEANAETVATGATVNHGRETASDGSARIQKPAIGRKLKERRTRDSGIKEGGAIALDGARTFSPNGSPGGRRFGSSFSAQSRAQEPLRRRKQYNRNVCAGGRGGCRPWSGSKTGERESGSKRWKRSSSISFPSASPPSLSLSLRYF